MEAKNIMVIFGAPDFEEKVARKIAEKAGCDTATATYQGKPVHAGNAYKADGHQIDTYHLNQDGVTIDYPENIVLFECGRGASGNIVHFVCDHHNPGDPGYNNTHESYWMGSSLGQLCNHLGLSPRDAADLIGLKKWKEVIYTAAGDHCPKDAYAGRCEDINPDDFFDFRIRQKAEFQYSINKIMGLDLVYYESMIREEIRAAFAKLVMAKKDDGIIDLREYGTISELPEAALKLGAAYMSKIDETDRAGNPTGNKKIVLGGCTTPKQVEEFMTWASNLVNKVGEPYGNQTRGYAGVVVHNKRLLCVCGAEIACANINICPECGTPYPDKNLVG